MTLEVSCRIDKISTRYWIYTGRRHLIAFLERDPENETRMHLALNEADAWDVTIGGDWGRIDFILYAVSPYFATMDRHVGKIRDIISDLLMEDTAQ